MLLYLWWQSCKFILTLYTGLIIAMAKLKNGVFDNFDSISKNFGKLLP